MSTAIIRIYTREGFVIAADGLRRKINSKNPVATAAQKIFPTSSRWGTLAFAFAGTTEYEESDSGFKMDWKEQAHHIAAKLQSGAMPKSSAAKCGVGLIKNAVE